MDDSDFFQNLRHEEPRFFELFGCSVQIPFFIIGKGDLPFENLDYLFIPEIRKAVEDKQSEIQAYAVKDGALKPFSLHMDALTDDEREIILKGCLINYYRG